MGEFKLKEKNFLGINDLIKDIKELSHFFKILMIIGTLIIIFFNFFDIQGKTNGSYFVPIAKYEDTKNIGSTFGDSNTAAIIVATLYSLNGIAAFTGLLSIAMIVHGNTSQYFWGMLNAIFFGMFALSVGYIGDFIMNIILLLGAPLGWYLFEIKGLANKKEKPKTFLYNSIFYLILFLITLVVILAWYEMLPPASSGMFGKENNAYLKDTFETKGKILQGLDAITNGMNSVGYVMQLTNMNQQFYVWFFVNISKILKFTGLAGSSTLNINMLLQFSVWFTMALIGLYKRNIQQLIAKFKNK